MSPKLKAEIAEAQWRRQRWIERLEYAEKMASKKRARDFIRNFSAAYRARLATGEPKP